MQKTIRKIAASAVALLMLGAGVSCSSTGSMQTSQSEEPSAVSGTENGGGNDGSADDTVITMATIGEVSRSVQKVINEFNETDNGYTIVVKDYKEDYTGELDSNGAFVDENGYNSVAMQLVLDLSRDGGVDLVSGGFEQFDNLARQGAFTDLYQFMNDDREVNRTTLNENVLKLFEKDGKLFSVPIFYIVNTLGGPAKYVGDKENWTVDDMIAHWEQMPEGATISGHTEKNYVYMTVLRQNLSAFYDFDTASASFDSPDFIRLLDFCNSFDAVSYDKPPIDYNNPEFLSYFALSGFSKFHLFMWQATKNGTEPFTLVGYPSEDGNGSFISASMRSFGICSYSDPEVQEGAWQFVRMFMTEEFCNEGDGFPINNSAFENSALEELSHEGEPNIISMGGEEYDVGYLTQEEYELAISVINGISRAESSSIVDDPLWEIINGEIDKLFDGTQNAETTAEMIQNRALIMLSEKQYKED